VVCGSRGVAGAVLDPDGEASVSVTGVVRLRLIIRRQCLSGRYKAVCIPSWSPSAKNHQRGRKPDRFFLPPPVGAIQQQRAGGIGRFPGISCWCGGKVQPLVAKQSVKKKKNFGGRLHGVQDRVVCRRGPAPATPGSYKQMKGDTPPSGPSGGLKF